MHVETVVLLENAAITMFRGRTNATAVMDTIVTLDPNVEEATTLRTKQLYHEQQCL